MQPRFEEFRDHITIVIEATLKRADPRALMREAIQGSPPRAQAPAVIAVGKAAAGMFTGWCDVAGVPRESVMVVPRGANAPEWACRAEHPVPAQGSFEAGQRVTEFIERNKLSRQCDGFVLLLSGGASALLASPVPPMTMEDLADVTRQLLRAGTPIEEFNRVRKHIEKLKGGRMAALMSPRPIDCYLISDVPDEDVSAVGSGLVMPDGSTFAGALEVLRGRSVESAAVERFLEDGIGGLHPETPKHGDPLFGAVRIVVVGSNEDAVRAAQSVLLSLGYEPTSHWHPGPLMGPASQAGRLMGRMARQHPATRSSFLAWGGETTVRVGPAGGKGGRNQEFALAAAIEIDGCLNIVAFSLATDGIDGPTDAAGAIVTGHTCRQARSIGLDPNEYLARHDSYTLFEKLDLAGFPHLVKTGPTGTNVNDIAIALVG